MRAPGVGKNNGTVRRGGGVRDYFAERGEREIEFSGDRLEEFCVDIDHFRDRAEKIWVNGDRKESRGFYLSVAIRWLITAQASSGRAFLITSAQPRSRTIHDCLRFDTAANDIDSPSCSDERTD